MNDSAPAYPTEQEIKAEKNPSRKAVLSAMLRLLEGRSVHNLSVAGLAREANVDRSKLTTGSMKDLGERLKNIIATQNEAQTPREVALMAEVARLKAAATQAEEKAAEAKAETKGWRATADTLTLSIAALHSDLKKAEMRIEMLNNQLKSQGEKVKELQGKAPSKAEIRLIGR